MKASILDLRIRMREILKAIDLNEIVTLTYRGKAKATINPIQSENGPLSAKEHPAFGIWCDRKDWEDIDSQVRKTRKGRVHAI